MAQWKKKKSSRESNVSLQAKVFIHRSTWPSWGHLNARRAEGLGNSLRDKQSVQAMMQAMCAQIENATAMCAHWALSRLHIHDLYICAAEIKRFSKMARSEHEYTTVATLTLAAKTRRCTSKSRNAKASEFTIISVRSCSAILATYIKRGKK